jgi:hypothetical protein
VSLVLLVGKVAAVAAAVVAAAWEGAAAAATTTMTVAAPATRRKSSRASASWPSCATLASASLRSRRAPRACLWRQG